MLKAIRQLARKLLPNLSGNAAMLVALGMPVLIGGTGLAVDTAQWYLWKRELQHAVDQAAIGGAWALAKDSPESYHGEQLYYRYRALQEYNANKSITKGFAGQPTITLADYAGGSDNSVVVVATASKKLPFSGFMTNNSATIRVRAQATFAAGGDYNACLVALAEESGVLDIGGNATVKARCGLAALSCEEDAVVIDGSATVVTDSIATCGTADVPEGNEDVVTEGIQGLEDIYKDLTPPDNPVDRSYECKTSGTGSNKTKQATLEPGTYTGGIVAKCTTVLKSGIYVIDGGELDLAANYDVTGTNVMFVLKNGAKIKFGGNGNDNKITLTPMTSADFIGTAYEEKADDYQGMLVFEDRNNNPANPGHILNGNSTSLIEGLMYLPSGEITIVGTADVASQCLQISAYKIKVSGGANLETLCPTEDTTSVGSSAGEIRLVA